MVLKRGDNIEFIKGYENISYSVEVGYLKAENYSENSIIFSRLGLNKEELADKCYGYPHIKGSWPECKEGDYEALTRLVNFIAQEAVKKGWEVFLNKDRYPIAKTPIDKKKFRIIDAKIEGVIIKL